MTESVPKVWIHPPKFWAATKTMSEDEVENLLDSIVHMAQVGDVEGLKRYDFVSAQNPRPPRTGGRA